MAGDLLQYLDSLDENEPEESYPELAEKVQALLKTSSTTVQAKLVNNFLQKAINYATESEAESMFKTLLPAAEEVQSRVFKDLQTWKDAAQVSSLLQVRHFCLSMLLLAKHLRISRGGHSIT